MKRRITLGIILIVIIAAVSFAFPIAMSKIEKKHVITTAQLEKAIAISELSTAEFVYNGVAEKRDAQKPEEVECYIAYEARVKVGIQMEEVAFKIEEENKTVTPILPEITINIAMLDENSISYIPKNPEIALKEVITLCKEDVIKEANESEVLYQIAKENLQAVMEALLLPILDNAGYSIVW